MMKLVLILVIFLFSINIALASDDISQFVFTTNPQTIKPNEVSETLTIQAQDANGNSVKIPQTGCLHLETTSGTGQFSSNSTNWESVSQLTMNKNTANRNFYYKDSSAGNYTLTVKAALTSCSGWTTEEWTAKQDIVISESASNSEPESEPKPEQQTTAVVVWPVEPQIYANAGPDKTAVAGADVYFSGQALGLQKEPLENARYIWNFGDGAIAEGQNVKHVYKYPGEYIIILDVSSGKYSASDRLIVKVVENNLKITGANENYIKLHNGSNVELDISFWFLKAENSLFKFPANTFIKTNRDLIIDSSISGLKAENQKAELLYPNGSVANSYFGYPIAEKAEKEKEPKPTTVADSSTKVKENHAPDVDVGNVGNLVSDSQVANVVASVPNDKKLTITHWLIIILGIGIVSAAGFIFIRRQSSL
jgi:hypothetical protein